MRVLCIQHVTNFPGKLKGESNHSNLKVNSKLCDKIPESCWRKYILPPGKAETTGSSVFTTFGAEMKTITSVLSLQDLKPSNIAVNEDCELKVSWCRIFLVVRGLAPKHRSLQTAALTAVHR